MSARIAPKPEFIPTVLLATLYCLIAPAAWGLADPPKDEPAKAESPKAETPKPEPPKIEVGAKCPDFSLSVIGPSSQTLTLAQLEGKDLLLEFWATWCGPCIPAREKLVRFHDAFSDRGLEIIAISDESPDVVARYLKRYPVPYTVATDEKGRLQEAYGVQGLPRCVLISREGVVRWMGYPSVLRDANVAEYLHSGEAPKPSASLPTTTAPSEPPPQPILQLTIAQSRFKGRLQSGIGLQFAPGQSRLIDGVQCHRQPLTAIFEVLLKVSKARLLVDPLDGDILYDVEFFHSPSRGDPDIRIFTDALLREAGLELREVEEMCDVWVAAPPSRELVEVEDQRGESVAGGGHIIQRGQSVEELFRGLENRYGILIVDETRLAARYKFSASYDCQQPWEETRQFLEKEDGLTFKPDRRKVRLFKLQAMSQPSTKTD
jgi:peroxiredoxin